MKRLSFTKLGSYAIVERVAPSVGFDGNFISIGDGIGIMTEAWHLDTIGWLKIEDVETLQASSPEPSSAHFTPFPKNNVEVAASILYETYSREAGSIFPFPDWETFSKDPKKEKHANAWRAVAKVFAMPEKAEDKFFQEELAQKLHGLFCKEFKNWIPTPLNRTWQELKQEPIDGGTIQAWIKVATGFCEFIES
jgi:hypothetical protein